LTDTPATVADVEAIIKCAYQIGRLDVTGNVNVQRIQTLKERFEHLETQLKAEPNEKLLRKILRLRKQILRACEIGLRNEVKLKELRDEMELHGQ